MYSRILAVKKYFFYTIDKTLNTLLWMFMPSSKIVVANVYLRHLLFHMYNDNLGDDLNYVLVKYLSKKHFVNYFYSYLSLFQPINYMCIGSIVRRCNKKSVIWGSGAMDDNLGDIVEKPLKVCAVRGPLTRDLLLKKGIDCPPIYGDPAIIFPYIYPCKKEKKYRLGIIPHFLDYDSIKRVADNNDGVIVIKMSKYINWKVIINQINECDFIVSSSLHGLILSDTYGVPNIWIKLSDKILGGNFKYIDYYKGSNRMDISKPIDYSNKEICIEELLSLKSQYVKPIYQIEDLLDSCPFAERSVLEKIKEQLVSQ